MRTVADHRTAVRELLAHLGHRPAEMIRVIAGAGSMRVLAADVVSLIDHPPFDNSQMDGYAVRAADVAANRPIPVVAGIPAGHLPQPLRPGTAAPIMTGAPVPPGADAVIPIEAAHPDRFPDDLSAHGPDAVVSFATPPATGAFVRRRGSDLRAGAVLLTAGTRLGPAQRAILAASGVQRVPVLPRVRVLVVSTGDELQPGGGELDAGRIHDANGIAMAASVEACGGEVVHVGVVSDDMAALAGLIGAEGPSADLILTTGGVSAGAYEVVRDVFGPAGLVFESVAMQPGGPQGLGTASLVGATGESFERPVVAFPGNPVSSLVSFEMFLRPALRGLHGLQPERPTRWARLAVDVESPASKYQVRRGILDADGLVEPVGGPGSHLLHSYAISTHLIHLPVGVSQLRRGDSVEVWSIVD